MRGTFRLVIVASFIALAALLAGCKGVTPPSMREDVSPAPGSSAAEPEAGSAAEAEEPAAEAPGAEEPKAEAEKPEEPAEKREEYAGSLATAGVAVGAELQHTPDWKVGGKLWAMTLDGKTDSSGQPPKVQLVAVKGADRTVIAEIAAGAAGAASVQGDTVAAVPPGTTTLLVTTTLTTSGKPGPTLSIALAEVPEVKSFTIVTVGE